MEAGACASVVCVITKCHSVPSQSWSARAFAVITSVAETVSDPVGTTSAKAAVVEKRRAIAAASGASIQRFVDEVINKLPFFASPLSRKASSPFFVRVSRCRNSQATVGLLKGDSEPARSVYERPIYRPNSPVTTVDSKPPREELFAPRAVGDSRMVLAGGCEAQDAGTHDEGEEADEHRCDRLLRRVRR